MGEVITDKDKEYEKMEREGSASADITLRTSIRMSDEAFAAGTGSGHERSCEQSFAASAFRGVQGVHDHRLG